MTDIDLTLYPDTRAAFDGSEQRAIAFLDRYAMKNGRGEPVEHFPQFMWSRVAHGISGENIPEGEYMSGLTKQFYDLLSDFKFVPGGRILAGAGTGTEVTFYNCYVIPVETKVRRRSRGTLGFSEGIDTGNDSREAIIDTVGCMVDIMSRGGGVGINWSVLRPSGAHLKTINATSSGPIDWMHFASVAVGTVEQGGSRRGAAMFMLDDWHPDVLSFLDAKRDETRITNANVSVCVSDEFMRRVETGGVWNFVFPDTSWPAYDRDWDGDINAWLDKGYPVKSYGSIPAREMWTKLAEAAHASGEPGVVFLDRYNKQSTAEGVERIISVNPCGEQGLGPYSVCNLGAMNLAAYVRKVDGVSYTFNWAAFYLDAQTAVTFLDRVIDENFYFLPENEQVQKSLRRIGLGVMGLADALAYLGFRYGSPEAIDFTEEVFKSLKHAALNQSAELAKELGPAPAWRDSMLARPYLDDLLTEEDGGDVFQKVSEYGLRNLFLLTQAPTGTTATLAGVNSGIEPFFALGYWREDRTGRHWVEPSAVTAVKASHVDANGFYDGSADDILVTANEVTVEEHIAMQAAAQKYIDSSVSKTINAPNGQTVDEVEKAYTLAYKSGLKGLAYYRDGSRGVQVLNRDEKVESPGWNEEHGTTYQWLYLDAVNANEELQGMLGEAEDRLRIPDTYKRPDSLTGRTHKVRSGSQTAYVTVNREVGTPDRPVEVFVSVGKSGTSMMEMGEAMGRLASIGLQRGLTLEDLIDQLDGVGNNGPLGRSLPSAIAAALKADIEQEAEDGKAIFDFATAIAKGEVADLKVNVGVDLGVPGGDQTAVVMHVAEGEAWSSWGGEADEWATAQPAADLCPECGSMSLVRQEGCKKCMACGYSAC